MTEGMVASGLALVLSKRGSAIRRERLCSVIYFAFPPNFFAYFPPYVRLVFACREAAIVLPPYFTVVPTCHEETVVLPPSALCLTQYDYQLFAGPMRTFAMRASTQNPANVVTSSATRHKRTNNYAGRMLREWGFRVKLPCQAHAAR